MGVAAQLLGLTIIINRVNNSYDTFEERSIEGKKNYSFIRLGGTNYLDLRNEK